MKRSEQTGKLAPNQGTRMAQTTNYGTSVYDTPALNRFPPPEFLTPGQRNIWVAALSDITLELFRARHIPIMVQYVRAVEQMMTNSDVYEADPDDRPAFVAWDRSCRMVMRLEKHLHLDTGTLILMALKARAEFRVQGEAKRNRDVGEHEATSREGLVYAGY